MKTVAKRLSSLGVTLALFLSLTPAVMAADSSYPDAVSIQLNDAETIVDGLPISTDTGAAVYLAPGSTIDHYEAEYASIYGSAYGEATSSDEWHTSEECDKESHVVITEPGTYIISGSLYGQLSVELDSKKEADKTVTLVLDGVDITCDVGPAVLFVKAYEYDATAYEDDGIRITLEEAESLDFESAGAKVIIADGSVNNITGSHVAKCYAYTVEEDGELTFTMKEDGSNKKRVKYDGAFYSKVSMTVYGEAAGSGVLNIYADNEGMNSEQHLVINGGHININSQDDGINTNDENGSVTMLNGGTLTINAGLGSEGDGIDSNGYLIINGGTLFSCARPVSDSGIDADLGSVINGGTVIALGSTMNQVSTDSTQASMMLRFSAQQTASTLLSVMDDMGNTVLSFSPAADDFLSDNARSYGCAILSAPSMAVGNTYTVYADGVQLGYTSLSESSNGQGGFNGGNRGELQGNFIPGENVDRPEGGFEKGEKNFGEAFNGEWPAEWTENGERPADRGNGVAGDMKNGQTGNAQGGSITEFTLHAMTNVFSSVGIPSAISNSLPFTDVDKTQHAAFYNAIEWAFRNQITSGTTDTTFSPSASCTRAQIVTFLWRASGAPEPASLMSPFVDVSEDDYFYKAVLWACEQGITLGTSETTFDPNGICTRKEALTFLYRSQKSPSVNGEQRFSDVPAGAHYENAVCWAAENGITTGTTASIFSPTAACTRAQIVTFLYRLSAI